MFTMPLSQGDVMFKGGQRPDDLFFLRQYRQSCEYSLLFIVVLVLICEGGLFNFLSYVNFLC